MVEEKVEEAKVEENAVMEVPDVFAPLQIYDNLDKHVQDWTDEFLGH